MQTFLALVFLGFIILFILGLIKPDLFLFIGEKKTRGRVCLIYGSASLLSSILFGILDSANKNTSASTSGTGTVKASTMSSAPNDIQTIFFLLSVFGIIISTVFIIKFIKKSKAYNEIYKKYTPIIDIETERNNIQKEIDTESVNLKKLKDDYKDKRALYEKLLTEIEILEEDLEYISFGVYKPHFDFDTSERYQAQINENRSKQKEIIKNKQAAVCHTEWTVSGSKTEGRKMTNRNIKLMLRAFNNECDSAVLKVKWNNVQKMEERIRKAHEAINKLGEPNQIIITTPYLNLKLEELWLAHEYQEKLYEEKEEQRRIREQIREEEKVQKEIEKQQREAEQDEERYQKALEEAQKEVNKAKGKELEKLNDKIALLQKQLEEAHEKKERALSRAQMTKSGHVYVISNIGSFGEDVFKIGMTRRLEPLDRVRELGDASVPFLFDVHAMIFSEDAPALENELHKTFHEKRLNMVNLRREFFDVSLDEIEKVVLDNHGEIEFTKLAEAKEYRETLAIKNELGEKQTVEDIISHEFPVEV